MKAKVKSVKDGVWVGARNQVWLSILSPSSGAVRSSVYKHVCTPTENSVDLQVLGVIYSATMRFCGEKLL
jgi:hypothetical protein